MPPAAQSTQRYNNMFLLLTKRWNSRKKKQRQQLKNRTQNAMLSITIQVWPLLTCQWGGKSQAEREAKGGGGEWERRRADILHYTPWRIDFISDSMKIDLCVNARCFANKIILFLIFFISFPILTFCRRSEILINAKNELHVAYPISTLIWVNGKKKLKNEALLWCPRTRYCLRCVFTRDSAVGIWLSCILVPCAQHEPTHGDSSRVMMIQKIIKSFQR